MLGLIVDQTGLQGSAVDPTEFLTLHMDRETVETLVRALDGVEENGVAPSLRSVLNEWLKSG